jgi:hypothetical protein
MHRGLRQAIYACFVVSKFCPSDTIPFRGANDDAEPAASIPLQNGDEIYIRVVEGKWLGLTADAKLCACFARPDVLDSFHVKFTKDNEISVRPRVPRLQLHTPAAAASAYCSFRLLPLSLVALSLVAAASGSRAASCYRCARVTRVHVQTGDHGGTQ